MAEIRSRLTILFEDPFWIGLYERESKGRYEACKIIFGAQPRDCEVYDFMQANWCRLVFSPSVDGATHTEKQVNPKRMQRLIQKEIANVGIGTKAQQALALQREQGKLAKQTRSREQREANKERQF